MADIHNATELQNMPLSGSHRLMNDIVLPPGFTPIGHGEGEAFTPFTGTFDGQRFKISGGSISFPDDHMIGLFACNNGTIKRLEMRGISVLGGRFTGALAGWNNGTIEDVISDCNVSSGNHQSLGGMVGRNYGTMKQCYCAGNVSKQGGTNKWVGGLVGGNGGDSELGGSAGQGTLIQCCAIGNVTNTAAGDGVGGLAGGNNGVIIDCFARGDCTDTGGPVGGLVGEQGRHLTGSIIHSYATGKVLGGSIGGLIGNYLGGPIHNAYYDYQTTEAAGTGTPRSTADMTFTLENPENFSTTYINWDFQNVWIRDVWGSNDGYPILRGLIGKVAFAIMVPTVLRSARPFIPCQVVFMNMLNSADYLHFKLSSPVETINTQTNPELFGFSMNGGASWGKFPPGGLPAVDALNTLVVGWIRVPPRTRVRITPSVKVMEGIGGDNWWDLNFVPGESWWDLDTGARSDWWNVGFPDNDGEAFEPIFEHEVIITTDP